MGDSEILGIKCSGCECNITPELHEVKSGEYEMSFFICPYCGKRYVISVTDKALRESIAEYWALKKANEEERLPYEEQKRMADLKTMNKEKSEALREALGYGRD